MWLTQGAQVQAMHLTNWKLHPSSPTFKGSAGEGEAFLWIEIVVLLSCSSKGWVILFFFLFYLLYRACTLVEGTVLFFFVVYPLIIFLILLLTASSRSYVTEGFNYHKNNVSVSEMATCNLCCFHIYFNNWTEFLSTGTKDKYLFLACAWTVLFYLLPFIICVWSCRPW